MFGPKGEVAGSSHFPVTFTKLSTFANQVFNLLVHININQ